MSILLKVKQFGSNLREWADMVRLEHTVFALPFALAGLILAKSGLPSVNVFFWTILAFAGARAAAMTVNRVIDAKIDALNPRTSERAIPAGRISVLKAQIAVLAAFALMIFDALSDCSYLVEFLLFY